MGDPSLNWSKCKLRRNWESIRTPNDKRFRKLLETWVRRNSKALPAKVPNLTEGRPQTTG